MAYFLGVDTGGTYTDAVIVDEAADRVIGSAKSLTTRGDLALWALTPRISTAAV